MTNPNDFINPQYEKTTAINHAGLTKREYFAALVLQGVATQSNGFNTKEKVLYALLMADTLIEELNKGKK